MLDLAGAVLQVPQTAGVRGDLVGEQNSPVTGLALLDLEIDELHVDLREDVFQRIVDCTCLAGDLVELLFGGDAECHDAVVVDERITELVGFHAEFEDRLVERGAFLDTVPLGEGTGRRVAHDDLERVHVHFANELLGVGDALDEVGVDAARLEQVEDDGGDLVVEFALAFDLCLLGAVAGGCRVHVFDPENIGVIGCVQFLGLALVELVQLLHVLPSVVNNEWTFSAYQPNTPKTPSLLTVFSIRHAVFVRFASGGVDTTSPDSPLCADSARTRSP